MVTFYFSADTIAKGFGAKKVEFEFKDNTQKLDIN